VLVPLVRTRFIAEGRKRSNRFCLTFCGWWGHNGNVLAVGNAGHASGNCGRRSGGDGVAQAASVMLSHW